MRLTTSFAAVVLALAGGCGSDGAAGTPDAPISCGVDACAPPADASTLDAAVVAPDAARDCTTLLEPGACLDCLEGACCDQLVACQADATCAGCLLAFDEATCLDGGAVEALLGDVSTCTDAATVGACAAACPSAATACNPVTSVECTDAGAVCDGDGAGGYVCYGPPNTLALCDVCPSDQDEWCGAGMTCGVDASCTRYCCDDGDCGTGTCDLTSAVEGVGTCRNAAGDGPACDAPAEAPSGGTCWLAAP